VTNNPSQFRATSLRLFAVGIVVLILAVEFSHNFPASEDTADNGKTWISWNQLPVVVPTLLGCVFILASGIRISLFARPWQLVIVGCALLWGAWLAPVVLSAIPTLKGFVWTRADRLTILAIGTLGLIFSTSGALRLLRNRNKRETF
jgi:hypothetical protein